MTLNLLTACYANLSRAFPSSESCLEKLLFRKGKVPENNAHDSNPPAYAPGYHLEFLQCPSLVVYSAPAGESSCLSLMRSLLLGALPPPLPPPEDISLVSLSFHTLFLEQRVQLGTGVVWWQFLHFGFKSHSP